MTEDQLANFKKQLLDQKAQIEHERNRYVSDDRSDTEEGANDDLADYDPNDPADEGARLFERERDQAAIDNMGRILQKIDRALQKMEEGTYGLSDIDGTPIPLGRLEAMPYALTTVEQEESN